MLAVVLWLIVFAASLAVLVKASGYFTDSAEKIGVFFKLPAFIIGVTIVALGTSLPELVSSIFAVFNEASEIVVSNVVGSNITNIFLILGVTSVIAKKAKFNYEVINIDLPILLGSAFLVSLMAIDGRFEFQEGILCIFGVLIYLLHTVSKKRRGKKRIRKAKRMLIKELEEELKKLKVKRFPWKSLWVLVISSAFIFTGAKYTVDSVAALSQLLGVGKEIIAGSVMALGTSLPELFVSIVAVKKRKAEIAVGNILGSNVFNTLGVMGIAGTLNGALVVPQVVVLFGIPLMIVATFLYLFITQDKEITRWEGSFLIIFYLFYLGRIFGIL